MNSTTDKKTLLTRLAGGVEGTTTFKSRVDSSYRFRLDAKQDKLRFWLEDRKSKNQWQTAELEMKDFVQKGSVIPHASFEDYAVCFLNCLEASLPSDDFDRDLVLSDSKRDLVEVRLTLKLRTYLSTWTPTYSLVLDAVPLERVDVLAAKVRDLEDVIERLEGRVKKSEGLPQYFRATTTGQCNQNQVLTWTRDELVGGGNDIRINAAGDPIQIKAVGVFVVNVFVQNNNANNSTTAQLQVNGTVVASLTDSSKNGHQQTTALSYVFTTKGNATVSVVYVGYGYAYAGSSLVIYELR